MYLMSKPHGKGCLQVLQSFLCSERLKTLGQVEGKPHEPIKTEESMMRIRQSHV